MTNIIAQLSQYTEYYPLVAFILLFLAGLNIPFSEDLIIITGALICREEPKLLIPTFAATYCGVTMSDYFPYLTGKYILRKGRTKLPFVSRLFPEKKLDKMHHYLEKYGIVTFIVGRFIPFGVRNTLFLSSGFFGLRLWRFALYDITAATISVSTLFFLVYCFGESIKKLFSVVGVVLFLLLLLAIIFIVFLRINRRKSTVDNGV